MTAQRHDLGNLLRLLILGLWAVALAWLLGSNRYMVFIQPKLAPLLAAGLALLVLFLLAAYRRMARPASHGPTLWHRASQVALLLVPLLYMPASAATAGLGRDAFEKRSVTGQTMTPTAGRPPRKTIEYDSTGVNEVTLLQLMEDKDRLNGLRAAIVGRVYHEPALPPGQFVVYRFMIVCCAADALPIGAVVAGPAPADLAFDAWVRVEGPVQITMMDGEPAPQIVADQITSIDAPANPYLSPY